MENELGNSTAEIAVELPYPRIDYTASEPWPQPSLVEQSVYGSSYVHGRLLGAMLVEHELLYAKRESELYTDDLTGLSNRRHLVEVFNSRIYNPGRRAQDVAEEHCLLFFDFDKFKNINDTYGHRFGDTALRCAAEVLLPITKREHDVSARLGGDEFMVLLTHTNLAAAQIVAEKIRLGIEACTVLAIMHPVAISGGIIKIDRTKSFEDNYDLVDRALYDAKERGGNQFCVLDPA